MSKTTDENFRRLNMADKYDDANLKGMIDRDFSTTLDLMIRKKGLTTSYLVEHTTLSKSYINKMRNPSRKDDKPSRSAIINIALGMDAALDETNLLLKRMQYQELYTRDKAESIIIWGMLKKMSGSEIRELLYSKGLHDKLFPEKPEKKYK